MYEITQRMLRAREAHPPISGSTVQHFFLSFFIAISVSGSRFNLTEDGRVMKGRGRGEWRQSQSRRAAVNPPCSLPFFTSTFAVALRSEKPPNHQIFCPLFSRILRHPRPAAARCLHRAAPRRSTLSVRRVASRLASGGPRFTPSA